MKVLLFTHSQDPDGAGCAVLANIVFQVYTLVPTKTFDINKNVQKYIDTGFIYDYDKIFVTDLCIKEPLLTFINNDEILKNKVIIIDHHKSEIDEGNDKYSFVNIKIEENGIKVSGTSLFYDYLVSNGYLDISLQNKKIVENFVEYTRAYDTWDGTKENFEMGKKYHILFENLSFQKYVDMIDDKITKLGSLEFNDFESKIISRHEENSNKEILEAIKGMKIINFKLSNNINYKIGFIDIEYKYRNDVNGVIKMNNKYDIDVIGMIMKDTDTVSYRQVKNVDVSIIGKYFGGKGHREAASNLKNNEKFKEFIKK